jgi:hypothetical protein
MLVESWMQSNERWNGKGQIANCKLKSASASKLQTVSKRLINAICILQFAICPLQFSAG